MIKPVLGTFLVLTVSSVGAMQADKVAIAQNVYRRIHDLIPHMQTSVNTAEEALQKIPVVLVREVVRLCKACSRLGNALPAHMVVHTADELAVLHNVVMLLITDLTEVRSYLDADGYVDVVCTDVSEAIHTLRSMDEQLTAYLSGTEADMRPPCPVWGRCRHLQFDDADIDR